MNPFFKMPSYLIFVFSFLISNLVFSQQILFEESSKDPWGIDFYRIAETSELYEKGPSDVLFPFKRVYKSIAKNANGFVKVSYVGNDSIDFSLLEIVIVETNEKLNVYSLTENQIEIVFPPKETDYLVELRYKNKLISQIEVFIFNKIQKKIRIVPLVSGTLNKKKITNDLNSIFKSAGLEFQIELMPKFVSDAYKEQNLLVNPASSEEQYTQQMRTLRDAYLEANPSFDKTIPLFFVVPGYQNESRSEFMVRNKSLGFVNYQKVAVNIARAFSHGFAASDFIKSSEKNNLLLSNFDGMELLHNQWIDVRNTPNFISYIDDYERVSATNGIVSFLFWEQNKNGEIVIKNNNFFESIKRPFKKNTYSYHLEISTIFYKTLFKIKGKPFNILHCLSVFLVLFGGIWFGRKVRKKLKERFTYSRLFRVLQWFIQWGVIFLALYFLLALIDQGYSLFEVKKGEVKELEGKSKEETRQFLAENIHPRKVGEKNLSHESVIEISKGKYEIDHHEAVMYFNVEMSNKIVKKILFEKSSNTISLKARTISFEAKTHYIVLRFMNNNGELLDEKVYNSAGLDLTNKLSQKDPALRILLFVNGYRPTALGNSLDKNIADIQAKGLEFPDSYNQIFSYDRYNYWNPWNKIDDLFKNHFNPSLVFYADGHHSVKTSNHRSLLNFTSNSAIYPKRCKNLKKHVCWTTKTINGNVLNKGKKDTYSLHRTRPNYAGFETRRKAGRIAGKNLIQLLNESPNTSENDTLYIVAHSMGFAYATGMIEEMKGKIQFNTYLIIAPENASLGKVKPTDWETIWQYGSKFNGKKQREAPCLLDGVAPQTCVGGLNEQFRSYLPKSIDKNKGFFSSHFIGYYTWIFNLKPDQKGYLKQVKE